MVEVPARFDFFWLKDVQAQKKMKNHRESEEFTKLDGWREDS